MAASLSERKKCDQAKSKMPSWELWKSLVTSDREEKGVPHLFEILTCLVCSKSGLVKTFQIWKGVSLDL